MIVYLIRNTTNGKAYVGKTKRGLEQRWREHVHNAQVNKDEMPLYFAIRKHGPESFELRVLQECSSEAELNQAEIAWIEAFGSLNRGYNATRGGDGISGYRHTDATKQRMSETRRGKKLGPCPEERKQKISASKMGTGVGPRPDVCGWHHREKARKKISEAQYVKVAQYDMSGNQVAIYDSMIAAEQVTGIARQGISRCCRFSHRSAKGFRFRYVLEYNSIVKE